MDGLYSRQHINFLQARGEHKMSTVRRASSQGCILFTSYIMPYGVGLQSSGVVSIVSQGGLGMHLQRVSVHAKGLVQPVLQPNSRPWQQ
jgi:hypothetical protein